jgi:hypothetical protein
MLIVNSSNNHYKSVEEVKKDYIQQLPSDSKLSQILKTKKWPAEMTVSERHTIENQYNHFFKDLSAKEYLKD